jgi:hypothetical protein
MRGAGALLLLPLRRAVALPFGLAAALDPPRPLCELNVAFGAASAPGEWPTAHAALWLFNNRGDQNFSSWQAVWTLPEADTLLSDTVTGAILINPGGPGGQPCRAINTLDNAPLLSGRGGRWFGYEFASTAAAPSLRAPTRLAVNGIACSRTTVLALDAAGDALLACEAQALTGCGFVWFCCGDVEETPAGAPLAPLLLADEQPGEPLEVELQAATQAQTQRSDAARRRTVAAAAGAAAGAAVLASAAGIAASRRRRARRRANAARLAAWREEEAAENEGDAGVDIAASRHVTFAVTQAGSTADSTSPLWRAISPPPLPVPAPARATQQPHPLHASIGASRRGTALPFDDSGEGLWGSGVARAWRDLVGFNAWATLGSGTASSVQSSMRSSALALTRRASSSASIASMGTSAPLQLPAAADAAVPQVDMDADVVLEELIGTGAFGAVYRGRWGRGGSSGAPMPVAVKMLHMGGAGDSAELAAFAAEVAVLARLSHPRIVRLLGASLAPPRVCMLEELVEGGSLHAFLHGPSGRRFTYREALALAEDVAAAMAYLHPTVVHRDLKSHNVLLDRRWRAKVCDFGIAKLKSNTYLTTKHVQAGTPAYMAPELFSGGSVSEKIDLWSFGTLLWEMYTGEVPWKALVSPVQVIFAVAVQHARLPLPPGCPPALAALMSECWRRAPEERPAFAHVLPRLRALRVEAGGTGWPAEEDLAHRTM